MMIEFSVYDFRMDRKMDELNLEMYKFHVKPYIYIYS